AKGQRLLQYRLWGRIRHRDHLDRRLIVEGSFDDVIQHLVLANHCVRLPDAGVGLGKGLLQAGRFELRLAGDDAGERGDDVVARNLCPLREAVVGPRVTVDAQGGGDLGRDQVEGVSLDGVTIGEVVDLHRPGLPDAPGAAAGLQHGVDRVVRRHPDDGREVQEVDARLYLLGVGDDQFYAGRYLLFHPAFALVRRGAQYSRLVASLCQHV